MQYQTRAAVVPGRYYTARLLLYPVGVVGAAIGFVAMVIGVLCWMAGIVLPHLSSHAPALVIGGFVAVVIGGSLFFTCGGAYE